MASPELEKLYEEATGSDSLISKPEKEVSSLEDLSMAQPDKDFTPPQEEKEEKIEEKKIKGLPGFDSFAFLKGEKEGKFMKAIKTAYTFDTLATIVENYGEENGLTDVHTLASKIRKGTELSASISGTIIEDFGISDQYNILVSEMLGKPPKQI